MERRFGHDFSRVRVHVDPEANQSARDVKALAYTVGSKIVFGAGQFDPASRSGRRLLAHELTHVVQQRVPSRGVAVVQRQPSGPDSRPTYGNLYPGETQPSARIVRLVQADNLWYEVGSDGSTHRAGGNYDFVVKNGEVFALQHKNAGIGADAPGHLTLAEGGRVEYAGQVRFGRGTTTRGVLSEWSNASGHIRPTGELLDSVPFPRSQFRRIEGGPGQRGPQLPVIQPRGEPTVGNAGRPAGGTVPKAPATGAQPQTTGTGADAGSTKAVPDVPGPREAPNSTLSAERGAQIEPVSEATPGYRPEAGAGIGGAIQMLQAMQFSGLQRDEVDKFQERFNKLQPKIQAFLDAGNAVELLLIVEQPNAIDFFCAAGTFCDQGQLVYFHDLFINYVESVQPLRPVSSPAPVHSYPTMGSPGGRSGYVPHVHEGGSLIDLKQIPYLKTRDPEHHCVYGTLTVYPPIRADFSLTPEKPKKPQKPKPQLDPAARKALADSPAEVYVESQNIVQYKTAVEVIKKLKDNPLFGTVKEDIGGGMRTARTLVSYPSALDKPKAEALVAIVRSTGVPTAYSQINGAGDGDPGVLTIWFGKDAEK
jgi:uncharacterized protein DUF4157